MTEARKVKNFVACSYKDAKGKTKVKKAEAENFLGLEEAQNNEVNIEAGYKVNLDDMNLGL